MDTKIIRSMVLCHVERKIRPNYWHSHDIIRIQTKDLLYLSSCARFLERWLRLTLD